MKYAQSIHCHACEGNVKMVGGRPLAGKPKATPMVEIDFVCVDCGTRGSVSRDSQTLPFSEREFCQEAGLLNFKAQVKGKGVYIDMRLSKR
jgi:hypothetical protein